MIQRLICFGQLHLLMAGRDKADMLLPAYSFGKVKHQSNKLNVHRCLGFFSYFFRGRHGKLFDGRKECSFFMDVIM